jgi:hypothetical protein
MLRLLLLSMLTACSAHTDPVDVLGEYLEAEQQGRYTRAHDLLSDEDQQARPLEAYIKEHLRAGPLWRAVATKTAFHVEEVTVAEERTSIQIKAVHPDVRAVSEGMRGIPNEVLEASEDPERLMYEAVREALANEEFPAKSEALSFQLVRDGRSWRVWLGLQHTDAAIAHAERAMMAQQDGDVAGEISALQALVNEPADAGGAVQQLQASAQVRLDQLKAPTQP